MTNLGNDIYDFLVIIQEHLGDWNDMHFMPPTKERKADKFSPLMWFRDAGFVPLLFLLIFTFCV